MDGHHHYHRSTRSALTLSQKQYAKITGTIASVRKQRELGVGVSDQVDNTINENTVLDDDAGGSGDDDGDDNLEENSFAAEESFIRAPLNPRIPDKVDLQRRAHFSRSKRGKSADKSLPPDGVLETLPVEIQEALVLEELLNVLMGIPGVYITCDMSLSDDVEPLKGVRFVVSRSLDPSLRDLTDRILPLATSYTAIRSFIRQRSNLENGLVNHALCASMRDMLKDYHTLIIQLEHAFRTDPYFSVRKLWFHVHPTRHTLILLQTLTESLTRQTSVSDPSLSDGGQDSDTSSTRARNAELGLVHDLDKIVHMALDPESSSRMPPKGGEVLTTLNTLLNTHAGDPQACLVYGKLLRDASRPYVRILLNWIKEGHLEDPYEEFMVRESRAIDRGILESDYVDEYWERRYTLRDVSTSTATAATATSLPAELRDGACIPLLLEPWKHKVLLAGKYLNVIRECGISVDGGDVSSSLSSSDRDVKDIAMDDERLFQIISSSYTHANKTLLHLLLHTHQLLPRLRTLQRFFFLSHSFYLTHFFDIAANELRKPPKGVNIAKLGTLLGVAVNADDVGATGSTSNSGSSCLEVGRDDIRLIMQRTSLVEWLVKISSVRGAPLAGEPDDWLDKDKERGVEKEKSDKDKSKSNSTAIDFLSLDYTPPFPLSLVISRKAILRYQLIFRFLLSLKYLEYQLCNMWIEQKGAVWRVQFPSLTSRASGGINASQSLTQWRTSLLALRGQMLAVVRHLLTFVLYSVLEVHWRSLEKKLITAEGIMGGKDRIETVDQLLRDHVDFLDTCLKECMLSSSRLVKQHHRLLQTCTAFTWYTSTFTKSLTQGIAALEISKTPRAQELERTVELRTLTGKATSSDVTDDMGKAMKTRWEFLERFKTNFGHWLKSYIEFVSLQASSENAALMPLVGRLKSVIGASHVPGLVVGKEETE